MRAQDSNNDSVKEHLEHVVEQAQQDVSASHEPLHRVSHKARILITVYLVGFALFVVTAILVSIYPVWPLDIAITKEIQEARSPFLDVVMYAVSYPGYSLALSASLVLVAAAAFWVVRLRLEALTIIALSVISSLLNVLIKYIVSRPRPTANAVEVLYVTSGQSFPSGHVMSYMAFWGLLFSLGLILFQRNRWWHYALLIIPAFFVVMVGPSRIYLGNHWASDVAAAYLIGALLLGITLMIYMRLKLRGVLTKPFKSPDKHLFVTKRTTH